MEQILKEYKTPTDVFVFGDILHENKGIPITDDYETLWIQFPDRIERLYLDTKGYFEIGENVYDVPAIPEDIDILVLKQFTGKLFIDVIGDVTENSLLKENFNKSEYLFEQLDEYNDDVDNPEYVLYVEGDYDDVYTTTLEKYLKR